MFGLVVLDLQQAKHVKLIRSWLSQKQGVQSLNRHLTSCYHRLLSLFVQSGMHDYKPSPVTSMYGDCCNSNQHYLCQITTTSWDAVWHFGSILLGQPWMVTLVLQLFHLGVPWPPWPPWRSKTPWIGFAKPWRKHDARCCDKLPGGPSPSSRCGISRRS